MADPLTLVVGGLTILGNLSSASSARRVGKQSQAIAEERADKSIAEGQQKARYEKHKGELVASRALALSAAGGGSATDPTSLNIIADIKGESAFREAAAMYTGEEDARILRMGGQIAKTEADAKASAYSLKAFGNIIEGGSSLYTKYKKPAVTVSDPVYERGYK